MAKKPPAEAGDTRDTDFIHGSERSPGVGSGNPLQFSCFGKFHDKGAWQATVLGLRVSGRTLAAEHTHTRASLRSSSLSCLSCINGSQH